MLGALTSTSVVWTVVDAISMVRLVRLGHVLPHIQEILHVMFKSLSTVFPMLLVLVLLTYLWSTFGLLFFGNDTYLADILGDGQPWEAANRHQGFWSVSQGMQTMLGVAISTGSGRWIEITERYQEATAHRWRWAVLLFFASYVFLVRFLLMKLFMMTILFKYKTHASAKVCPRSSAAYSDRKQRGMTSCFRRIPCGTTAPAGCFGSGL